MTSDRTLHPRLCTGDIVHNISPVAPKPPYSGQANEKETCTSGWAESPKPAVQGRHFQEVVACASTLTIAAMRPGGWRPAFLKRHQSYRAQRLRAC